MKVAFVTGSNKGIGFGIVAKLAHAYGSTGEWDIYLTARNVDLGQKACEELKGKGLQVNFHQLDITDAESRKNFLAYMKAHYPDGINIAVNNAGIAYKHASTAPFGEQARVTVHTNFTCTLDFTLEFLPLLAEDARVVHVSSMASHMTLKKLGDELYAKFTSVMSLDELRALVGEFVKHAEAGDHEKYGWPTTAYGISKVALSKASYILGDSIKNDSRRIVMNAIILLWLSFFIFAIHQFDQNHEPYCLPPFGTFGSISQSVHTITHYIAEIESFYYAIVYPAIVLYSYFREMLSRLRCH